MTTRLKQIRAGFVESKTLPAGRAAAIRDSLTIDSHKAIYKEAYGTGMNLSRYLEKLDPSKDHPIGMGDAFQRVLASCGIKTESDPVRGIYASTLEDVVENKQYPYIAPLAIEIIARAYRAAIFNPKKTRVPTLASGEGVPGSYLAQFQFTEPRDVLIQPAIPLDEVIGRTTGINGAYYKPFYLEDVSNATSRVAEAAEFPAVRISTSDKIINLVKYGRRLDVTYEALRRIPIDLMAFHISRIAIQVEADKLNKIVDVMVNGDGNTGTSATSYNLTTLDPGTTANNLTLRAWLAFKMKFLNPLYMTTVLANEGPTLNLMMLNMGTANIPLVNAGPMFGAQAVVPINQGLRDGVRAGWVAAAPSGKLIGFDKRFSIERVFEIGANIQETDKDVISQLNSLVLSEVEAYDIIDPKAAKILNTTA